MRTDSHSTDVTPPGKKTTDKSNKTPFPVAFHSIMVTLPLSLHAHSQGRSFRHTLKHFRSPHFPPAPAGADAHGIQQSLAEQALSLF